MKRITGLNGTLSKLFAMMVFIGVSLPSNAHIIGISWNDIGNNTIRFYGETAHGDLSSVGGGALQIGPWANQEFHDWTGWVNNATFADLGIDGYAYWSPDDPNTLLHAANYSAHSAGMESYGDFYYLDVPNFESGQYLLTAISRYTALDRQLANSYLVGDISVPEPPIFALFGAGLLGVFLQRRFRRSDNVLADRMSPVAT